MAKVNSVKVLRAEYFEDKIGKWVAFYEGTNLEHTSTYLNTPIAGNPRKRIAEYEKSGVKKVKYTFVKEVTQI